MIETNLFTWLYEFIRIVKRIKWIRIEAKFGDGPLANQNDSV